MGVPDVRKNLEEIRSSAEAGNLEEVVERVNQALHALDERRLLTTTEAAVMLGIRSINTLKLLVRQLGVPYERHGNRMMLALEDVEWLKRSTLAQGIRASDAAHDAVNVSGDTPLTQEQLDALAAERPGKAPWSSRDFGNSDE